MDYSDFIGRAWQRVSRRRFMGTAAAAAVLASSRITPANADVRLDMSKMPSQADVWRDVVHMNEYGPRHAGNAAQAKYTAFMNERLAAAGLKVEPLDRTGLL